MNSICSEVNSMVHLLPGAAEYARLGCSMFFRDDLSIGPVSSDLVAHLESRKLFWDEVEASYKYRVDAENEVQMAEWLRREKANFCDIERNPRLRGDRSSSEMTTVVWTSNAWVDCLFLWWVMSIVDDSPTKPSNLMVCELPTPMGVHVRRIARPLRHIGYHRREAFLKAIDKASPAGDLRVRHFSELWRLYAGHPLPLATKVLMENGMHKEARRFAASLSLFLPKCYKRRSRTIITLPASDLVMIKQLSTSSWLNAARVIGQAYLSGRCAYGSRFALHRLLELSDTVQGSALVERRVVLRSRWRSARSFEVRLTKMGEQTVRDGMRDYQCIGKMFVGAEEIVNELGVLAISQSGEIARLG